MKRYVPLSLIGSAIVLCLAASSGQAATVTGVTHAVPAAAHSTSTTPARWRWYRRHHHCWWSHHHRHCR
jgi:hypothetical protein